ncbi:hypothetical protein ETAA8_41600 [Anatilimnocola aggregata]|uniref:Uncharacterized protein n=1 Tax=Anatilimnocola aggregata TaxID=2528021 RepID=A0A517YFP7_9BACT|nr:hypothetical protein [Anatilimnocola aggregata]QDU29053.1 hypothetical protein ETAA8_41600 [Anatilimnocola aggregata]
MRRWEASNLPYGFSRAGLALHFSTDHRLRRALHYSTVVYKRDFDLPENWQDAVYSWLSNNRPNSLENTDDQGGWPDEDDLTAAFEALGYKRVE